VRNRFDDRTRIFSITTGDATTTTGAATTDSAGTATAVATGTGGATTVGAATTGAASCTCATGTASATPVATGQADAAALRQPKHNATLIPTQLHKRFITQPPVMDQNKTTKSMNLLANQFFQ
jgi:hypothetical protein